MPKKKNRSKEALKKKRAELRKKKKGVFSAFGLGKKLTKRQKALQDALKE